LTLPGTWNFRRGPGWRGSFEKEANRMSDFKQITGHNNETYAFQ
jgi:hypothetical protein